MLSQRKRYSYLPNVQRVSNCDLPSCSTISTNSSALKFGSISSNKGKNIYQNNKENHGLVSQQAKQIEELQTLNQKMLDQTTQKFMKLQQNLLTVEKILTQKQVSHTKICGKNQKLKDQKKQLIRVLNQKNMLIKKQEEQIQNLKNIPKQVIYVNVPIKDSKETSQNDTQTQQAQIKKQDVCRVVTQESSMNTIQTILESGFAQTQNEVQTKATLKSAQTSSSGQQTSSQSHTGLNYRQKYQCLFKRALQMQDQMYRLKEELFDAKSQLKSVNQQFNTYKILKQIETIQKK